MKNRAWDLATSDERGYISGSSVPNAEPKSKQWRYWRKHPYLRPKQCRLVMGIGICGTGVGSRIKGHLRLGGGQMRRRHRRYEVVSMTDEYRTSQTCATCFGQVVRPAQLKTVNGRSKRVTCNGGSICMNSSCPSYQTGTNTRNRDVEAAKCIAIASTCQILKGSRPLPLAKNKISQSNTEASTFTAVTDADAQPVTDISRTLHH
jgi:hypothetical protein